MSDTVKIKPIRLGCAKCAVDLSDGSERGEYVNQDYILQALGRPHRAVNLMYCYYPLDKGFPERASVAFANEDIQFQWDYPYDDYFPYRGGLEGDQTGEPFTCMRDIRRHGQDVILTLTIDPHVSDAQLIAIAKDLKTFGRMQFRINHEATGDWFSFNKRCTYQEVADFYVRFHNIVKEYAPNVHTILCVDGIKDMESAQLHKEDEFTQAIRSTDIWSVDRYLALHWGWPYDVAERGGNTHRRYLVSDIYELARRSYQRFCTLNDGVAKPMVMSELNADGDVTGAFDQAEMVKDFCMLVKNDPTPFLTAFTFYQFRDRGRLGLEIQDPNNKDVGIRQPVLEVYKEIIRDPFFSPTVTTETDSVQLPITLRWGGAEDATGIALSLDFKTNPVFCEVTFDKPYNLIMEINGRWFYKSPNANTIDLMPAFYEKPLSEPAVLQLNLFAPPASGENDSCQGEDWMYNYYTTITTLPSIRIRFEPISIG